MGIRAANREYERWLKAPVCTSGLVEADLKRKHKKMRESAFTFLRATYWRWAETILDVCPDLTDAPPVLAVGDIHLENFGTWTDREGRSSGASTTTTRSLRCLTFSTWSAGGERRAGNDAGPIVAQSDLHQFFDGYEQGIDAPEAFVLDHKHMWLRKRFVVSEAQRALFYHDRDRLRQPVDQQKVMLDLHAARHHPEVVTASPGKVRQSRHPLLPPPPLR